MGQKRLTTEQEAVISACMNGRNVFFTGSAGTGKTWLLRHLVKKLKALHPRKDAVAVVSATGVSALALNAVTLHSFEIEAGVGLAQGSQEKLAREVRATEHARRRWARCEVLIVDEISQISAELLVKLEFIARKMKPQRHGAGVLFGGIQVVVTGDFFQLPPVGLGPRVHYAFDCSVWKDLFYHNKGRCFVLKKIFRQGNRALAKALNQLRRSEPSSSALEYFEKLEAATSGRYYSESFEGVELCATRKAASKRNLTELEHLKRRHFEVHTFHAEDTGRPFPENRVPSVLELTIGTRVVLVQNLDVSTGLVNGLQGTVVGFEASEEHEISFPRIKFSTNGGKSVTHTIQWAVFSKNEEASGKCVSERVQLPLVLGWALTIHRAQGMELGSVRVNCAGVFEYGQCYVALSRCTNPENMRIIHFERRYLKTHPRVHRFVSELTLQLEKTKKGKRRKRSTLTTPPKKERKTDSAVPLTEEKENVNGNAQPATSGVPASPVLMPSKACDEGEEDRSVLIPETPRASPGVSKCSMDFVQETPKPGTIPETPAESSSCSYKESPAY